MVTVIASLLYAFLAGGAALVQICLTAGAPWGALTLGGRWQGKLPPVIRCITLFQATLLVMMGVVVLAHANLIDAVVPPWVIWVVVAITALSTVANLMTPSVPERQLWGPVTLLMLATSLIVALV